MLTPETPRPKINPPIESKIQPMKGIQGPPIMRSFRMAELDRILRDPLATNRDKAIARQQLRDLNLPESRIP